MTAGTHARPPVSIRSGVGRALPVGLAVLVDGVAFGLLARTAGIGPAPAVVMSALVYSGSAQYAGLAVVSAGGSVAAAAGAAFLLNLRNVPMGVTVAGALRGRAARRLAEAQLTVTDESWALGQSRPGHWERPWLLAAGAVTWLAWVAGTAAGALGGSLGGVSPRVLGLDAVYPAVFLALLVPLLHDRRQALVAVTAAAVALALVPVAPPGLPLLAAAAVPLAFSRRRAGP